MTRHLHKDPMPTSSKRPWLLVFVNAGALLSTLYQMHHIMLLISARG